MDVELQDVAPDRVERQRAYHRGEVPLPATPDLGRLEARLAEKGLGKGNAIFIRIFKASSELEVWLQKDKAFVLLDTYPICHWTGTLGPKLKEGDKQSPEGFYSVARHQIQSVGRWPKAFNLGFPNLHDQLNKRTGSYILVHGGCSSVGCFAMTEQVHDEIHALASAAIKAGQERFHVHVYPFRMTDERMAAHADHAWAPFWRDLKAGYDSFERTRIPPKVAVCEQRYIVADGTAGETGDAKPIGMMKPLQPQAGDAATACTFDPVRLVHPAMRQIRVAAARGAAVRTSSGEGSARRQARRGNGEGGDESRAAAAPETPNGFGEASRKGGTRLVSSSD